MKTMRASAGFVMVVALLIGWLGTTSTGQTVRGARRGAVSGSNGTAAAGPRGVAVSGEEGQGAAVGRRGAVVKGEEGYAAVGRHGAVAAGDDGAAAVTRRGAVVAGEEGVAAAGRYGNVVVGGQYEDYEGWRRVSGPTAVISVGTMLARPPAAATTIVVAGSSYWHHGGVFYMRAYSGGVVKYQVIAAPVGAIIGTLPAGCSSVRVGAVVYQRCGPTHYQRVATGYKVVVIH
jgi:hypothetical protein